MYPLSQTAGYDRVATMFSPDGRLYQVEYASKIVAQGTLGAALKYGEGIMFGADKMVSSRLTLPQSIEKLFRVDDHVVALSAGLVGDARRLAAMARQKAQENVMYYDQSIEIETLVKEISNIKQLFTQYGGMRPFGVSFIIGGVDSTGKRLFETEPSGALAEYSAIAIGRNREKAMQFFEKNYKDDLPFDAAVALLLKGIKSGLAEKQKLDYRNLEFGYINNKRKFAKIPSEILKGYAAKI
jgi:proteasome alpha subunit